MNRSYIAVAIATAALVAPAGAAARVIELGQPAGATPSCPTKPCLAVSHTTGFQTKVGSRANFMTSPASGRVVAFTMVLVAPSTTQSAFFDSTLGGAASAQITVLKPGRDGKHFRTVAQGEVIALAPYFGTTAQFPLTTSLPIAQGEIAALTIPTWAPALAVGQPATDAWRASRDPAKCDDTTADSTLMAGQVGLFTCRYRTAQLTYSATVVTTPTPAHTATPTTPTTPTTTTPTTPTK